ncbi:unnamed protein product [Ambrosiozyma monospora]|uniref:Unnamed protein product n=1 Tax=Ambrosiozyma monospora TaxID=43982 RepID=A0ACB5U3N4_AMBMO|nr:unnamed protein product [Ambrosiozyma monospora]
MPFSSSPTKGEGKKNLASRYLEAIGSPAIFSSPSTPSSPLKPLPGLRLNKPTDLKPSQSQAHLALANLKENENPFKSPKKQVGSPLKPLSPSKQAAAAAPSSPTRTGFGSNMGNLSPVKRLILQKERDAVDNNAIDFLPMPVTAKALHSPVKFTGFKKTGTTTTTTANAEQILSKSEIRTMNSAIVRNSDTTFTVA